MPPDARSDGHCCFGTGSLTGRTPAFAKQALSCPVCGTHAVRSAIRVRRSEEFVADG